jgi:hypothetical protein
MTSAGIGFGQVPSKDDTWEIVVGGKTFVFTKTHEKSGIFAYNCKHETEAERFISASSTGYRTDRDLSRAEVEARQQFREFIAERS